MNQEKKESKEVSGFWGYSTLTLVFFLVMHACSFFSAGLGISRASEHFNYYDGSMSYTEIPAIITVRGINETPDENYSWEVLQFGCTLNEQQEIIADIKVAGIPKEEIETIFYSRQLFDAPLDSGSTYLVKLDIHANFYSFLFKDKTAFGIHWWRQLTEGETPAAIEPYPWPGKLTAYAIACWVQIGLILSMIYFASDSKNGPRFKKKFSAGLALVFLLATLWIIYVDYPFYKDWSYYFLQVIALAIGLSCLGYIVWQFRKPDEA
jgi:hypothetical protein